jgi:S1-C subfamily serine protease
LHGDYHKPSDTWDKIDAPQTARLLDMIANLIAGFREDDAKPRFTQVTQSGHEGVSGAVGGISGSGAYFGLVPDFGEEVNGVTFSDVREGSPAAKAGLKTGDILVEFAGKPIGNLYDLTYALRASKPGDSVKVTVLRHGSAMTTDVELTARQ